MYAVSMPEFRVVNAFFGVVRTVLSTVKTVMDTGLDAGISLTDSMEARLPDIPLLTRPGSGASAYRALSAGRYYALGPGAAVSDSVSQRFVV